MGWDFRGRSLIASPGAKKSAVLFPIRCRIAGARPVALPEPIQLCFRRHVLPSGVRRFDGRSLAARGGRRANHLCHGSDGASPFWFCACPFKCRGSRGPDGLQPGCRASAAAHPLQPGSGP